MHNSILKRFVPLFFSLAITSVCLFGSAGRLDWSNAWVLMGINFAASLASSVLMWRNPELLAASDIIAAYNPPGGERLADVVQRWISFHADLSSAAHERVLVVTHAGMLHALMRSLRPSGAEEVLAGRFRFQPASVTRVRIGEDGTDAVTLSDVRHLDEDSPHWLEARCGAEG